MGRNVPFVVLDQPHNRQLPQVTHVQSFAYFTFCHGRVADGTHDDGCVAWSVRFQSHQFSVLDAQSNSRSWNGLHAGCTALVRYARHVRSIERRVAVISPASTEWIVALGKKLKHQLLGCHSHRQQHAIIAVVRT